MVRTRAARKKNPSKSRSPAKAAPNRPKKKKRSPAPRRCVRVCLPAPPYRDTVLDKVIEGIKDTRFEESMSRLVGILGSKYRRPGTGVYGMGPTKLVQSFVTKDRLFNYNYDGVDEAAGIVETWKHGLEKCKSRTRERDGLGETMFYLSDYLDETISIARLIADICFVRYAYEDLSENPGSNGVSSATEDSRVVEQIVVYKVLKEGHPMDIVEVLRLFAVF